MAAVLQPAWISVEDYLAAEQLSDVRHEYVAGAIYAMAVAGDEHIEICMNIGAALRSPKRLYQGVNV